MASIFIEDNDNLNRLLFKAILLHLSLVIIAIVFKFVSGMSIFDYFKKEPKVEIVQSAVRVDVVGLPKIDVKPGHPSWL